jgi:hypothetical protein
MDQRVTCTRCGIHWDVDDLTEVNKVFGDYPMCFVCSIITEVNQ